MSCKWNYEFLNNHLQSLFQTRFGVKDAKSIYEIDLALEMIMIMLDDANQPVSYPVEEEYEKRIKTALNIAKFYRDFYLEIEKLHVSLNPQIILPKRIIRQFYCEDITLSEKEIFELTHDFYKEMAPCFMPEFLKVFDNRQDHFEFRKPKQNEGEQGYAYFIPFIDDIYITVIANKSYSKLNSTVHEYGHGIGMLLNRNRAFDGKNLFDEVEALFFDIISKMYFAKLFNSDLPMVYLLQEINSAWYNAQDICRFNQIAALYNSKGRPTSNQKIRTMLKKSAYSNAEIEAIMNSLDLGYDYHSCVGTLIALELAYIYIKNPDKALYLLKHIILLNYKEVSLRKINDMGIYLNQNVKPTIKLAKAKIYESSK